MIKVSLHGAEFFAYHGFYPEEQLLGNRFIVNIEVEVEPAGNLTSDHIADTINYEHLYAIADKEMKYTRKLLEAVAQSIANVIRDCYPHVNNIHVELKKLNPPLQGSIAWSSVTVTDNNIKHVL